MSFIIAVHVKEGMVLAGDSRTTYTQTAKSGDVTTIKIGTRTTDTTNKVLLCPNNIGIATCGDASLDGVPITGYIESFIREHINQDTDIINVPQMLIDYFHTTPKVPDTNFLVVGYRLENDIPSQQIFWLNVKDESVSPIGTTFPGARWMERHKHYRK